MAIINEIKCARCDRKYSGVRSRCPYCGARRIGRGKYSENTDNAKGKMLISILIMAAFTVAAGVLLFTTDPADASEPDVLPDETPSAGAGIEDDIDRQPGLHPSPPPVVEEPEPVETPPPIEVTAVQIRYGPNLAGLPGPDGREITVRVGTTYEFRARVEPVGLEGITYTWESTNTDAFEAIPVDVGGIGVSVTGLGRGNGHLVLTVGDREDRILVRVVP